MPMPSTPQLGTSTVAGAITTAAMAFVLAFLIHWARGGGASVSGKGRTVVVLAFVGALTAIAYAHMRRQWLQYLRQQTLAEVSEYVSKAQGFDAVAASALTLVQEVELVSRGYKM